jgi:hypothetical protein
VHQNYRNMRPKAFNCFSPRIVSDYGRIKW